VHAHQRFFDTDAHVLEPSDLWKRFLEPEFQAAAPETTVQWYKAEDVGFSPRVDGLVYHQETRVAGTTTPAFDTGLPGVGHFQVPGCAEVYREYQELGFGPEAYKLLLDRYDIDYMALYPSAGLAVNTAPRLSAEQAAAHCRAYNSWLYGFCQSADSRLIGVGSVDLRDPAAAAREAGRCVRELGFRGIQINPEPLPEQPPLQDDRYEVLWSTLSDLDVPLALHLSPVTPANVSRYYFGAWSEGVGPTAFILGNMAAAVSLIVGGVLERHPGLRVVHLETGCGWVPFWLERLEAGILGSTRELRSANLRLGPREYFQRQCFVAADSDDPWIGHFIEHLGDDSLVTCTDFGHPEGKRFVSAVEDAASLPGVSQESIRKIMWENGCRLYGLDSDHQRSQDS